MQKQNRRVTELLDVYFTEWTLLNVLEIHMHIKFKILLHYAGVAS